MSFVNAPPAAVHRLPRTAHRFRAAAAVILSVGLTLAACSGEDEPEPRVVDDTDTITEWTFSFEIEEGLGEGNVGLAEPPTGWDVRIVWSATPCQTAPTVRLEETNGRLAAGVVDPGPDLADTDAGCDDKGVWHALDLKTSTAPAGDFTATIAD